MICIFSTAVDQTTTDVIRWIHGLGAQDVVRVNADASTDECRLLDVSPSNIRFQVGDRIVELGDITSAWYHKGRNWLCPLLPFNEQPSAIASLNRELLTKMRREMEAIADYVHHRIATSIPTLGGPNTWRLNKLIALEAAFGVGLSIPTFMVSTSRQEMLSKMGTADLVTKAAADGMYFFDHAGGHGYFSYTELLPREHADALPQWFPPSLVQSFIHKKFDVRTFVLADELFSMAILSQNDHQTSVDFRKYNEAQPNRCVPYRLPADVAGKIRLLFRKLQLNTGSVDFAVSLNDTHYFLEVNPVGQFGMISDCCNYNLERRVAEHLLAYART